MNYFLNKPFNTFFTISFSHTEAKKSVQNDNNYTGLRTKRIGKQ